MSTTDDTASVTISEESLSERCLPPKTIQPLIFNDNVYYTLNQIADAFGVPLEVLRVRQQQGCFHGIKLGVVYVVDGNSLHKWIAEGNFTYTPRKRGEKVNGS